MVLNRITEKKKVLQVLQVLQINVNNCKSITL